ncbi:MAG: MarR family transcriptional regulator [Acidimicrobiales bacterium]
MPRVAEVWTEYELPGSVEQVALLTSLERANRIVGAALDAAIRPLGLSRARFEVLLRLYDEPSGLLRLGKIGEALLVHPTSVTSLVDRLEKAGYVRRQLTAEDRRAVLVEITDTGRRALLAAAEAFAAIDYGVGALTAAESTQLRRGLVKLMAGDGAEGVEE